MSTSLNIKPDLLEWAISRTGYAPGDFYESFPKARTWIEENKKPTLAQLRDFAKKAHVPFGYLFLQQPPKEELPIPLFRTLEGQTREVSVNLRDVIMSVQKRQDWVKEYLLSEGTEPLEYIGSVSVNDDPEVVAERIRQTLGLDYTWAKKQQNWEEALRYLTEKIQDAGIFVVFNGVVDNNTHRPLDVEEFRGFVLADDTAPFMFINSADSKAAQLFTTVHELAHIWVGESAAFEMKHLQSSDSKTEKFCDKVAAEFLVPARQLNEHWDTNADITKLSRVFKVSPVVIGRRAMDLGLLDRSTFFQFYDEYMERFYQRKKKNKEKDEPSGNFYATLNKKLNPRFLKLVHQAVQDKKLLHKRAYELTALKGSTYHEAVSRLGL